MKNHNKLLNCFFIVLFIAQLGIVNATTQKPCRKLNTTVTNNNQPKELNEDIQQTRYGKLFVAEGTTFVAEDNLYANVIEIKLEEFDKKQFENEALKTEFYLCSYPFPYDSPFLTRGVSLGKGLSPSRQKLVKITYSLFVKYKYSFLRLEYNFLNNDLYNKRIAYKPTSSYKINVISRNTNNLAPPYLFLKV